MSTFESTEGGVASNLARLVLSKSVVGGIDFEADDSQEGGTVGFERDSPRSPVRTSLRALFSKEGDEQVLGKPAVTASPGGGVVGWPLVDLDALNFSPGRTSARPSRQLPSVDRSPAVALRAACRAGTHVGQTSGLAPGFAQANFVALPREHARDFVEFARRNPKACPVLAVTEPGDASAGWIAPGADLRTDIPKYRVWRDGEMVEEVGDIAALWDERDDMVGFLLGCSFTFENVLIGAGLMPRHVANGTNVPMYRTNVPNQRAGPFGGNLVVSMRPYTPKDADAAAAITRRYPCAHGDPVNVGQPALLGLDPARLGEPTWGDGVEVRADEVPVFWACGVTPQTAIEAAKLPLVITHAPGHMFVCDVLESELIV